MREYERPHINRGIFEKDRQTGYPMSPFRKEVCMDNSYLWKQFEASGNITDYLKYTACTSEDEGQYKTKEGKRGGDTEYGNWNGVGRHASW